MPGIVWRLEKKTDSAGRLQILLPGSCNQVAQRQNIFARYWPKMQQFPNLLLVQFQTELTDRFGVGIPSLGLR